jgi:hypothetical protein
MSYNNIPEEMKQLNQWVGSRATIRFGKRGKLPIHSVNKSFAKTNDPITWSSFADTIDKRSGDDGIGFVVQESNRILFIDLDDCIIEGKPNELALSFAKTLNSYYEISPSGTGLHIFCKIRSDINIDIFSIKSDTLEIYYDKRYCHMTGNCKKTLPLKELNKEQEKFLSIKILENSKSKKIDIKKEARREEEEYKYSFTKYHVLKIRDALQNISANDEHTWFNVVTRSLANASVKHPEFAKGIKILWNEWSQDQDGYNEQENEDRWYRACETTNSVTLGSLFHLVKEQNPDWQPKDEYTYTDKGSDGLEVISHFKSPSLMASDLDDLIKKHNIEGVEESISNPDNPDNPDNSTPNEESNAYELSKSTEVEKNNYIIDRFLTNGTTLLCSNPKSGKSSACSQMAISLSTGSKFMNEFDVIDKGNVLLISNEETKDSIIKRLKFQLNGNNELLKNITIAGIEEHIIFDTEGILKMHKKYCIPNKIKHIFIDIWEKAKPKMKGANSNAYNIEYEQVKHLVNYSNSFNINFIVCHHLNKSTVTTGHGKISGSQALRGAWDSSTIIEDYDRLKEVFITSTETRKMGCTELNTKKYLIQRTPSLNWQYNGIFNGTDKDVVYKQILYIMNQALEKTCYLDEIMGGLSNQFGKDIKRTDCSYILMLMIKDGLIEKVSKQNRYGILAPKREIPVKTDIINNKDIDPINDSEDIFENI